MVRLTTSFSIVYLLFMANYELLARCMASSDGIKPPTSYLKSRCSNTELREHSGTPDRIRTCNRPGHYSGYSTIELQAYIHFMSAYDDKYFLSRFLSIGAMPIAISWPVYGASISMIRLHGMFALSRDSAILYNSASL